MLNRRTSNNKVEASLLLCNDEINSFDEIVEALMSILDLYDMQAIQCTYIAHLKGFATIETGSKRALMKLRRQFRKKNITTIIKEKV